MRTRRSFGYVKNVLKYALLYWVSSFVLLMVVLLVSSLFHGNNMIQGITLLFMFLIPLLCGVLTGYVMHQRTGAGALAGAAVGFIVVVWLVVMRYFVPPLAEGAETVDISSIVPILIVAAIIPGTCALGAVLASRRDEAGIYQQ